MQGNWIQERELHFLAVAKNAPELSGAQRAAVERVDAVLVMNGARPATRVRFANKARRLGNFLKKPYEQATREDLARFLGSIADTYTPEGVRYVKGFLKRFYTLLLSPYDERIPDVVSWIKAGKKIPHKKPPPLLAPEDVRRMLAAARSVRDKAIIAILYESGVRISELCGLSVGDVEFDKYGARITVDGKTGVRRVRLIQSAPDLRDWMNMHPCTSEKASPSSRSSIAPTPLNR